MKKIYLLLAVFCTSLASCFEDEGNYNYSEVEEIVIEGLGESYTQNSYNGEILSIDPVIKTAYTDLEYEWWMWQPDKEESNQNVHDDVPYEAELISTDKKLAYEVNCSIGRYTLMLKVKSKSNGYFAMATTRFDAQTKFTRGFYILKETADGNTELDLYNRDNELMPDLLETVGYGAMKGKPRCLSMVQSNGLMDESNEYQLARTACVTTEDNEIAFYNTENMEKVHDETDVIEGGLPEGAKPYAAFSYSMSNFFLWSGGVNLVYTYEIMPTSGTFYIPSSTSGASTFVMGPDEMSIFYWNEQEQRIENASAYEWGPPSSVYDENGYSTQGMTCLACGASRSVAKGYWVLKDAAGKQYIYESGNPTEEGATPFWGTRKRVEIAPDSKLARATEYAVDEWGTNTLYFVADNQLYRYNLTSYTESGQPLALEGISDSETITYLSYQYSEYPEDVENNFKHLVVGTQQGDTYRIYMYNLVAGEPQELVRTIEGQGKLKMCTYIVPLGFFSTSVSLPN